MHQSITQVIDDDGGARGGGSRAILRQNPQKAMINAEFIRTQFAAIADAFPESRHVSTENTLHEFEVARGKRLPGNENEEGGRRGTSTHY